MTIKLVVTYSTSAKKAVMQVTIFSDREGLDIFSNPNNAEAARESSAGKAVTEGGCEYKPEGAEKTISFLWIWRLLRESFRKSA